MQTEPPLWRYTFRSQPADQETAYREHFLDGDIRMLVLSVYAVTAALIGLIILDSFRLAGQPSLLTGLIVKVFFLIASVTIVMVAVKLRRPTVLDMSILIYTVMYAVGIILSHAVADYAPARMSAVIILFILVSHIAYPVYAAFLLPATSMLLVGEYIILFTTDRVDLLESRTFILIASLFTAVISVLTSTHNQRSRKISFQALSEVKTLSGFLPICAQCKKIRDDDGYYQQIEKYISERSDARFTHGICPSCAEELYGQVK